MVSCDEDGWLDGWMDHNILVLLLYLQVQLSPFLKLTDGTGEVWRCRRMWHTGSTAIQMAGTPTPLPCWPGIWTASSREIHRQTVAVWSWHHKRILRWWDRGPVTTAPSLCRPESGTGNWCVSHQTPEQARATTPRSRSMSSVSKWAHVSSPDAFDEMLNCSFSVSQSSQKSSGWMPTIVKPQTLASPWSSSPWCGQIHLPRSPLLTSLASWKPIPLTSSFWIHEATPGWPITRWESRSAVYQEMSRWMPATVWERRKATSHWQVRKIYHDLRNYMWW